MIVFVYSFFVSLALLILAIRYYIVGIEHDDMATSLKHENDTAHEANIKLHKEFQASKEESERRLASITFYSRQQQQNLLALAEVQNKCVVLKLDNNDLVNENNLLRSQIPAPKPKTTKKQLDKKFAVKPFPLAKGKKSK